jgi:hypothetical protein
VRGQGYTRAQRDARPGFRPFFALLAPSPPSFTVRRGRGLVFQPVHLSVAPGRKVARCACAMEDGRFVPPRWFVGFVEWSCWGCTVRLQRPVRRFFVRGFSGRSYCLPFLEEVCGWLVFCPQPARRSRNIDLVLCWFSFEKDYLQRPFIRRHPFVVLGRDDVRPNPTPNPAQHNTAITPNPALQVDPGPWRSRSLAPKP